MAATRFEKLMTFLAIMSVIATAVVWVTCIYVAYHFISRYW